jgi:hypothetical protein
MKTDELLREQIFEIIKSTYDRLQKQGFDDFQTRQMIGQYY